MREQSADERLEEAKQTGELEKDLKNVYILSTVSGEKIVGVVANPASLRDGDPTKVKNARQIFSMTVTVPGRGVVRKTMIGTLDLALGPVDSMWVTCSNWYRVTDQSLATQKAILEELEDADKHDTVQRAEAAGIATASAQVSDRRPFSSGV